MYCVNGLDYLQVAPKTYIPALFGHASDDRFIQSHHSDLIFKSYAVFSHSRDILLLLKEKIFNFSHLTISLILCRGTKIL